MWNLVNLALVTWLVVWPKWKLRNRAVMAG
jgi:hypothetical protein